jgi:hypothetical protein
MYIAIFHTATAFLLTTFLTPLSVNLEEFTDGKIGLFLPTEPILFGLLIWMILMQLKKPFLTKSFWLHPITLSITFYLLWMFITSITSSLPMVSFKFLLMKIWYIVPILLLGFLIFKKEKNIERFIWCYAVGMTIAISYTLIRHAGFGFGEEEGHWVMSPLFKDHTIYGAAVTQCTSDRKMEAQDRVVYWLIIDYLNKAKQQDPSVASTVNRQLPNYEAVTPSTEDKFFTLSLENGQKLTIDGSLMSCYSWINETVTVR